MPGHRTTLFIEGVSFEIEKEAVVESLLSNIKGEKPENIKRTYVEMERD